MKTGFLYMLGIILMLAGTGCEKKTLAAECNLPADPGICMAAIPRYYYNTGTHQCEQFTWGGCGDFPFETMAECESACK